MNNKSVDTVLMHHYIDEMMEERELSDRELARRLGVKDSAVRMLREGKSKVSFEKIPDLADALGADRASLMNRALREYMPSLVNAAMRCFGELTDHEIDLINYFEDTFDDGVPPLTDELREKLKQVFARS